MLEAAEKSIKEEVESISKLSTIASASPYYKYNSLWTRDVQNVIFAILLCGYLGGMGVNGQAPEAGKLLTIEEVGEILNGMYFTSYAELLLTRCSPCQSQGSRCLPY